MGKNTLDKQKIKDDIIKLELKRIALKKEYPATFQQIAKKYKISMQYLFRIKKELGTIGKE